MESFDSKYYKGVGRHQFLRSLNQINEFSGAVMLRIDVTCKDFFIA
jgi:hypothetical protein